MTTTEPSEAERQQVERDLRIRRFGDDEMAGRTARVQAGLARHGLDALLVTDEVNVVYLTGLATPSFVTRARPLLVLVPAEGAPTLICSRSQSAHARAASWVQDIRPFERFEPDALAVLVDLLAERGLAAARIGCELGPEQRLGLTYQGFTSIGTSLPGLHLVDGSPVVWAARAVKSPAEVELMRAAGALNSAAMDRALRVARPGATERDVRDEWALALAEGGADRPGYLALHSGPGSYRRISSTATDRVLAAGDLLWMDGGPVHRGYWSDITRMVALGPARAEDRRRYAFAWQAVQDLIAGVRPGITAGDVARRGAALFAAAGLPMGGASRIGHGIGAELTEPPSIVDGDETELVEGMTLSIETGIAAWDGYFLMEDNIVVTAGGHERLSVPAPAELPEVL